jgi:hypothetical protein
MNEYLLEDYLLEELEEYLLEEYLLEEKNRPINKFADLERFISLHYKKCSLLILTEKCKQKVVSILSLLCDDLLLIVLNYLVPKDKRFKTI